MLGGAVGSALRYSVHILFPTGDGGFPFNTLAINIVGSFVLGVVAALVPSNLITREWTLLLGVGLCGGFTTFSTFSVEALYLLQLNKVGLAALYTVASVIGGCAAAWGGWLMGRQFA